MLDKRTSLLLEKINELCKEGSYKIVEESELLSCFPIQMKADADGVRQSLRYLFAHKYIDIRYEEDGVYCLCPLPEGRQYFENERALRWDSVRRRRDTLLFTALGAFLGGLLGSLAVWLTAFLLGGV